MSSGLLRPILLKRHRCMPSNNGNNENHSRPHRTSDTSQSQSFLSSSSLSNPKPKSQFPLPYNKQPLNYQKIKRETVFDFLFPLKTY